MKTFQFTVPLGISRVNDKNHNLDVIYDVLGRFKVMRFSIARISVECIQINLRREGVPTAQNGEMDIDETIGGIAGDTLHLTYGETLTINELSGAGVRMTISSQCHL